MIFTEFLSKLETVSGHHSLIESVREGYLTIMESEQPSLPAVEGWTSKDNVYTNIKTGTCLSVYRAKPKSIFCEIFLQSSTVDESLYNDIVMDRIRTNIPYAKCANSFSGARFKYSMLPDFLGKLSDILNSIDSRTIIKNTIDKIVNMNLYTVFASPCESYSDDVPLMYAYRQMNNGTIKRLCDLFSDCNKDVFGKDWGSHTIGEYRDHMADIFDALIRRNGVTDVLNHLTALQYARSPKVKDQVIDKILTTVELDPLSYTDDIYFGDYALSLIS